MTSVVIVGGGVGGLASAIRLGAAGHDVTLVEANRHVGGKLDTYRQSGYSFDLGPSLVTRPSLLIETLDLGNVDIRPSLVRLDTHARYFFADGISVDISADVTAYARSIRAREIADQHELQRHGAHVSKQWAISQRHFVDQTLSLGGAASSAVRNPRDLAGLDVRRTVAQYASARFRDPRAQQMVMRYATYSGSSPFLAPAVLACAEGLERDLGAWYVMGGLGEIARCLETAARNVGVEILTSTPARAVVPKPATSSGWTVDIDGRQIDAERVVFDVDPLVARRLLDPTTRAPSSKHLSTSGLVVNVGKRSASTLPALLHHNVMFGPSYQAEYRGIHEQGFGATPTVYLCVSSITDPTQAPAGCQNWFVLVNVDSRLSLDVSSGVAAAERTLNLHNLSLYDDAEFVDIRGPRDIAERTGAPHGAIYGRSSNGPTAALARQPNKGRQPGTYFVGGGAHPGGGLPLVLSGAKTVTRLIAEDSQ